MGGELATAGPASVLLVPDNADMCGLSWLFSPYFFVLRKFRFWHHFLVCTFWGGVCPSTEVLCLGVRRPSWRVAGRSTHGRRPPAGKCLCVRVDCSGTPRVSPGTPSGPRRSGWTSTSSTTMQPGHSPWRGPSASKCPFWWLCAEGQEERQLLPACPLSRSPRLQPFSLYVPLCSCPVLGVQGFWLLLLDDWQPGPPLQGVGVPCTTEPCF